ncbi:Aspartate/glutamate/uridylate kinase [Dichotomocladium elegans]|nr:Aspartate/glutamate/uridylate kinase [Dichotomocladium elegans]
MKSVIIKLGGAAITDKKGFCQLAEPSVLDALMIQLQSAHESLTTAGYRVILVHGAGSFGHPQAQQYSLTEGWDSNDSGLSTPPGQDKEEDEKKRARIHDQKAGFAHTRQCVLKLHLELLTRMQQRHLPVLGVSPFDHVETDGGGEKSALTCFEAIARRTNHLLNLGFIPVLHGDAVLDRSLGCTILSGDIVMHKLALLTPNVVRCVFITDVEGIFDIDPKTTVMQQRPPALLKHLRISPYQVDNKDLNNAKPISSEIVDVTGGMAGKRQWARQIILDTAEKLGRTDMEIVICKAGSPDSVKAMALDPVLNTDHAPFPGQRMTVFSLAQCASPM